MRVLKIIASGLAIGFCLAGLAQAEDYVYRNERGETVYVHHDPDGGTFVNTAGSQPVYYGPDNTNWLSDFDIDGGNPPTRHEPDPPTHNEPDPPTHNEPVSTPEPDPVDRPGRNDVDLPDRP